MSQLLYRRKAILTRIRKALDAFYLLQKIDWEFDVRATLDKILALAIGEVEFEDGRQMERALVIVQSPGGGELEVGAGWTADEQDMTFSRTVVQRTMQAGEAILCENAKDDPRFMQAESLKHLATLSLISVPLTIEGACVGALYIESKSPGNLFHEDDLEFLKEFTDVIAPYVKAALTHQGHLRAIERLRAQVGGRYSFSNIIGKSECMQGVFDLIRIASQVDRTVLLTGESGCGKEMIAHAIHYNGPRREKPFVVVDCSSLSEHLLESELFGHRKGAFTGASGDKIGAFEEAAGGTIFLDEISDASKPLQQKLRRVLQEGEIRRVGENLVRKVDVRVVCATNKNLPELAEKGLFLRDLYFRVNKFPVHVPALRERREDIPLLVEHFLSQASKGSARRKKVTPEALALLVNLDWAENNVRELRNTVELAVDLAPDDEVTRQVVERVLRVQRGERDLAPLPAAGAVAGDSPTHRGKTLVHVSREHFLSLLAAAREKRAGPPAPKEETPFYRLQLEVAARAGIEGLRAARWKLRPAARLLGVSPTKLRYDLKQFLERTLEECGGKLEEAAAAAEIPVQVLRKKARDWGLSQLQPER